MKKILLFILVLLIINALMVIVAYCQVKKAKVKLDNNKNELYVLTEKDNILYYVFINKENENVYLIAGSRQKNSNSDESDRVLITLFENDKIIIPALEGKYGNDFLYKTSNIKYITGIHIRNIKEDKGILFFCFWIIK